MNKTTQNKQSSWRLLDTGLRRAAENIAMNQAILAAHQQGYVTNTLRFLRFHPTALLGYHQSAEQELHVDYCVSHGIDIQRRITGGGAIYFEPSQLGWELYFNRDFFNVTSMDSISERICEAAAKGISALGVNAKFRPRNDIEVDGRKISGTGGSFDGSSVMFQGTLLIDFDVERMLRILRIPIEKLTDKAIQSARDRVTDFSQLLSQVPRLDEVKAEMQQAFSRELNIHFESATAFAGPEQSLYEQALTEIDNPEWINLIESPQQTMPIENIIHRCRGGTIRVSIMLDTASLRLKQTWISGDFFVTPKRAVMDLEAQLKNVSIDKVKLIVLDFCAKQDVQFLQMSALDVYDAIQLAIDAAQGKFSHNNVSKNEALKTKLEHNESSSSVTIQ
ncbi:MAG: biotin/lipoate A/B protein ligase family protein [Thiohalomonadales bacterium]